MIASEPITDIDTTASDMLEDLDEWLNTRGISLVFAEMKDPVQEKIRRYELTRTIDPSHFFPTIRAAVSAYRELTPFEMQPEAPPTPYARRDRKDQPKVNAKASAPRRAPLTVALA